MLGAVKSRLAKTVGDKSALSIYTEFLKILECTLNECLEDVIIYFSETITNDYFNNYTKKVQVGNDLGERMQSAFQDGFSQGYKKIVLIGSDIPDLQSNHIQSAFESLTSTKVVFGPSHDGGYYLIGLSEFLTQPFELHQWSTQDVLSNSLNELEKVDISYALIEKLNDIDTFEDLLSSRALKTNKNLHSEVKKYHDKRN